MLDFHCHILPGIDDGARTMHEAVKLAQLAAKEGVTAVLATPHYANGIYNTDASQIRDKCIELATELGSRNIPLQIISGAEMHMTSDILKKIPSDSLITLGETGNYALLELPDLFIADGVKFVVRNMIDHGVVPVVAHPERNPELARQQGLIENLVQEGAMMQITAGSFLGDFGGLSKRISLWMLENELVHCIGSDWHPGRKYRMAKVRKRLHKLLGAEQAEKILNFDSRKLIRENVELQIC